MQASKKSHAWRPVNERIQEEKSKGNVVKKFKIKCRFLYL